MQKSPKSLIYFMQNLIKLNKIKFIKITKLKFILKNNYFILFIYLFVYF